MPGARFERDFTDEAGNLLAGSVTVAVARENSGPAQVYTDRNLTAARGSTWVQSGGAVSFFAAGGAYRITVTQGSYSRTLRYVAIGLAGETDLMLAQNAGEWDSGTTYARNEYVVHNGVGIFISTQADNLNHEPDDATPGSTDYWTYYPGVMGPTPPPPPLMASIIDAGGIAAGEYLLERWAPGAGTHSRLRAEVRSGADDATIAILVNGDVAIGPVIVEAGTPLEQAIALELAQDDEVELALLSVGAGDVDWLIVQLDTGV